MKKSLPIALLASILACIMLACVLAACGPETTDPQDSTQAETQAPAEDTTEEKGEETTDAIPEGTTQGTTEDTTEPIIPEVNGVVADFNAVSAEDLAKFCSGPNQIDVKVEVDKDGEQYIALSTKIAGATDPFVDFSFKKFYKKVGMAAVDADVYKYVVLKVRNVNCSTGTFELFFYSGSTGGATGSMMTTSSFDLEDHEWQYVLFDLSSFAGWKGNVNGFRFDYMTSGLEAGETLHIAEIQFLESDDAYYKLFDIGWDEIGVIADQAAKDKAQHLLGSVSKPNTKYDTYTPLQAEHEDASLSLWFDHLYNRTPQATNTSNGKVTYQVQLAKNEIEGCQFLVGAQNDVQGLKVYVTDFTNEAGDTLQTDLFWGYYFNVEGERVIDPLPPVTYEPDQTMLDWVNGGNGAGEQLPLLQVYDGFDVNAGENQAFIIKATGKPDSAPGEYFATVTVVDKDGNEVKKATVFAYVWNFELPEASSCKTLMSLSGFLLRQHSLSATVSMVSSVRSIVRMATSTTLLFAMPSHSARASRRLRISPSTRLRVVLSSSKR